MSEKEKFFQKEEYEKIYQAIDKKIAIAIFLILFAITILVLAVEFLLESKQIYIGIIVTAILIITALAIILRTGFINRDYRKKVAEIPDCYTEEEKEIVKKKLKQASILGIIIAFVGIIGIILSYTLKLVRDFSLIPFAVLFFLLACILPQIAYWKLEQEKMDAKRYNKQTIEEDTKKTYICTSGIGISIILSLLTVIIFDNWDIAFSVFCVGSLFTIVITLKKHKNRNKGG